MIQVVTQPRITAGDLGRSSLSRRAMIVSLNLSAWGAERVDRNASRRYTRSAQTAEDAAKVHKLLVPKEALDPITAAHRAACSRTRLDPLGRPAGSDSGLGSIGGRPEPDRMAEGA